MQATELPGTCALQVIYDVDCLGAQDAYSKKEAAKLRNLVNPGQGDGQYRTEYITASIVTISDDDRDEFKMQKASLLRHGFQELGSWPGAHPEIKGRYKMHLFGSKEFKLPRGGKK